MSQLRVVVPTCYPSLGTGAAGRRPSTARTLVVVCGAAYKYEDGGFSELPFVAVVAGYMPGGYIVDLPSRRLHASAVLDQMERDKFISIETRALFIDFALYNANINTFCVVRLVFEHLETGGVLPYATFRTARLLPYEGDWGSLQFALDGLVISCVVVLLASQLAHLHTEWRRGKGFRWQAHFLQRWVFVDWMIISCFWAVLATRYYVRSAMQKLAAEALFDRDKHYPLFNAAMANLVENNLLAFVSLVVYLKTFKYMRTFPLVHRILNTIAGAQKDMASFVVVFAVVMIAFSLAFHLCFGLHIADFRGVGVSFTTLLRFVLGDVDIAALLGVNATLALVLAGLFTFLVYLQLIAIAVAVLMKAYANQPSDRKAALALIEKAIERKNRLMRSGVSDLRRAIGAVAGVLAARRRAAHDAAAALDGLAAPDPAAAARARDAPSASAVRRAA